MPRNPTTRAAFLAALAAGGCAIPGDPSDVTPPPIVASEAPSYVAPQQGGALPVQQRAKTTLLEENERLRDLLQRALAEKRDHEQRAADIERRLRQLEQTLAERDDAIATLSEQIQSLQAELDTARKRAEKAEKERKAMAEMFALERRQRLALEKELLERELAERTGVRKESP